MLSLSKHACFVRYDRLTIFIMNHAPPLPGIRFETQPAKVDEALPRMDIAVFVGFASRGDFHMPIPIEGADQFTRQFGEDAVLAWDEQRSEPVYAHLAAAVRAFFRAGGRRCWVVRVPAPEAFSVDALADAFLDPGLRDVGLDRLTTEADFIRYQSDQPRALTGIHAALELEEATLIAAPDAVQRGWAIASADDSTVTFDFAPLPHPDWWPSAACDSARETAIAQPRWGLFLNCDVLVVPAPVLAFSDATVEPNQAYDVSWVWPDARIDEATVHFVLEEATDSKFESAAVIYTGGETRIRIYGRGAGDRYYRVRAIAGANTSDWSNGARARITHQSSLIQIGDQAYADAALLAIQRSLLRLCAARGDLFAVLTLPAHYRELDAIRHAQCVQSSATDDVGSVPRLGDRELHALSYGAIYHPWLYGREPDAASREDESSRLIPPDGAACGVLARRALERGAWVAPANEPLRGVFALEPEALPQHWEVLHRAQLNVIRHDPRGFLMLDADTLSLDPDLRPINVRRLLALLRRMALRVGARYVFEPNDAAFRRLVQRAFEAALGRMFALGAFSGKSAAAAFQVVTGERLNTPQDMEQGRFVVELRVAPSQPLRFLTVRLVQTNEGVLVSEGA